MGSVVSPAFIIYLLTLLREHLAWGIAVFIAAVNLIVIRLECDGLSNI